MIIMFLEFKFFKRKLPNRNTYIYADTKHLYEKMHTQRVRETERDRLTSMQAYIIQLYTFYTDAHAC